MSIRDIHLVMDELNAIPDGAKSIFWDSMREAGEIVAKDLARRSPGKSQGGRPGHNLASSFGVWQSKRLTRKYRAVVFRVGLNTNYFYSTLAKGRKAHKRNGKRVRASSPSHPSWQLPGEDQVAIAQVLSLTRSIFNTKLTTIDRLIARGRRR